MLDGTELEELWFERHSVRLHAVAAGPNDGPLLVLLHGFPEFWYGWHRQIGPLARAGYRVVVPDQRGYNLSSKPADVSDYAVHELVGDVIAIGDQLRAARFYLAGHDWGAAVAWATAMQYPERVRKLVIVNVPHPAVMMRNVQSNPRQMLRSWYIGFFQIPCLPEGAFSANGFAAGISGLKNSSLPGTFSEEDFSRYRGAWSRPGAVSAMINWYRALLRHRPQIADPQVHVPTRILWGKRDRFLLPEMAEESLKFCDSAELTYFAENTHWLQHEQPGAVTAAMTEFFR